MFAAPRFMLVAVNAFGAFIAMRVVLILLYATISGQMPYPGRSIVRAQHPTKFWCVAAVHAVVLILGLFLAQLPMGE